MYRWKNAVVTQDVPQMKIVRDKLLQHIGKIYKDCKIDQNDLEAEGLGLRPLTLAENMGKSERNILARRYYRLGQWSEALQGGYWLTVSSPRVGEVYRRVTDGRTPIPRCFDITRSLISWTILGSVGLTPCHRLV